MLNQETKRRIDSLRDILVGKVPDPKAQVEQITIALIYKFMNDMDELSIEFGGEPTFFKDEFKKYSWSNIMSTSNSGLERVHLYMDGIEKLNVNPGIPQLFRDIFRGAFLPYRDPETLHLFLKGINQFTYEHSEDLGDAYEYLLSVLGSQGDAGQFRTPRHIIDMIIEIVAPTKNQTILDPACGTAGFLISAYKHILEKNKKDIPGDLLTPDERKDVIRNLCGYDISPDMVRLSRANMYLHGFPDPKIFEYDTLTSEDRWNDTYDVILANPPFMTPKGGIKPHSKFSVSANRSEVLFVDYIAEHLNPNGRAGVIVPEGIIFQSANAYKGLRKFLIENNYLYAVISLPSGVFQPYSGVKTSVLLMDRALAKRTDKILFVKIENDGFGLGAQRREIGGSELPKVTSLIQRYKIALQDGVEFNINDEEQEIANIVEISKISESGDYNLSGDRYSESIKIVHDKWPISKLGEICSFEGGTQPPKSTFVYEPMEGYIRLLQIRDYKSDKDAAYIPITERHKTCSEADIMIGRYGPPVFQILRGKCGAYNVALMKCVPDKTKLTEDWLYYFLSSESVQSHIIGLSTRVRQSGVRPDDLAKLLIPLPPIKLQMEIVAELQEYQKVIDGATQVITNYKPKIKVDPNWDIVDVGELCNTEYGFTDISEDIGDTRYVRITDISEDGLLKNDEPKYIKMSDASKPYILKKGDLVVARTGATYGKTLYFDGDYQAVFASYLIRLNFKQDKVLNKYYWVFTQSEDYLRQKQSLVQGGGQPQFNANSIVKVKIPIPPIDIQQSIVSEIEEEQKLINVIRTLIRRFEDKIKDRIAEMWG